MPHVTVIAWFVSASLSLAIWLLRHRLSMLIRPGDLSARQTTHESPTLRLGSVGIFVAVAIIALTSYAGSRLLAQLFIAATPVFLLGLCEDIGLRQSPRARLIGAAVSSLLALWLLQCYVPAIGLPGVDDLLAMRPLAVLFTIFCMTGLVHGFNLIDGLNGLAGLTGVVGCIGLLAIADQAGLAEVSGASYGLIGALCGFLALNFPRGRLFLGDAGAYGLGFFLAGLSVHMMASKAEVSPWALLLVVFWPFADSLVSILRRLRQGNRTHHPDRLHFHHLMLRGVKRTMAGRGIKVHANPIATALLLPLISAPAMTGVLLWKSPRAAATAVAIFALLFVGSYALGQRLLLGRRFKALQRRDIRARQQLQGVRKAVIPTIGAKSSARRGQLE